MSERWHHRPAAATSLTPWIPGSPAHPRAAARARPT